MKAAVSQDSFCSLAESCRALGTLKKLEDARLGGAYQAVIITARFRKMRMDLQVVFNRDKAVVRVRPKTTTKSTMAAQPSYSPASDTSATV